MPIPPSFLYICKNKFIYRYHCHWSECSELRPESHLISRTDTSLMPAWSWILNNANTNSSKIGSGNQIFPVHSSLILVTETSLRPALYQYKYQFQYLFWKYQLLYWFQYPFLRSNNTSNDSIFQYKVCIYRDVYSVFETAIRLLAKAHICLLDVLGTQKMLKRCSWLSKILKRCPTSSKILKRQPGHF